MRKNNIFISIKNFFLVCFVFVLVVLVYNASSFLISNSFVENFKIDEKTSNYLSFNYIDGNNVFELNKIKVLSDFKGKKLLNDYYDFEVSIPDDAKETEDVKYEIILEDMGSNIDERFIKVYLTCDGNKELKGFDNNVPVLAAFSNSEDGKVIYTGTFNNDNNNDKYRLRIWISETYKEKVSENVAFSVKVKIK